MSCGRRAGLTFAAGAALVALLLPGCPDASRDGYVAPAAEAGADVGAEPGDAGADGDATASSAPLYVFMGDWNADGVATPGTYDPARARWALIDVNGRGANAREFAREPAGGVLPIAGDWNGDGSVNTGTYDPATHAWKLWYRNQDGFGVDDTFVWYEPGIPVVGDWDGNRTATPGFYDPATHVWRLSNKRHPEAVDLEFELGTDGAIPIVGDWNGDRADNAGVYDPATHTWHLKTTNTSGGAVIEVAWGTSADALPLAVRLRGAATYAVFEPGTSTFTIAKGYPDGGDVVFSWGAAGRYAVVGGPTVPRNP
jgi:hypothetical protein